MTRGAKTVWLLPRVLSLPIPIIAKGERLSRLHATFVLNGTEGKITEKVSWEIRVGPTVGSLERDRKIP